MFDFTCSDNFKEKYFNEHFDRFSTMGHVGKYCKYRNRIIKGKMVFERRLVNLTGKSVKRIMRKEWGKEYSYWNALPLPVNEISRVIGSVKNKKKQWNRRATYVEKLDVRDILTANSESFALDCQRQKGVVLSGA